MCTVVAASQVNLPDSLGSGRMARRFLGEHWCTAHDSADLDQARLLVSELVINAVQHGGPPIVVAVECTGPEGVTLRVSDGGAAVPVPRDAPLHAEDGRGMRLVDLISQRWGVERHVPVASKDPALSNRAGLVGDAVTMGDGRGLRGGVLTGGGPLAKTVWCHLAPA